MSQMSVPQLDNIQTAQALKFCCAAVYESQWAQLLLGESFHPGGLALTKRIGDLLTLSSTDRVLDIASGKGTSAFFLAETFGCAVVGIDYGRQATQLANQTAKERGLAHLVQFEQGDAERLPFPDNSFTAVICECAFCTFPDKTMAASEMARVLVNNGRVGLSDLTKNGTLPPELDTLIAWIACIADAKPIQQYKTYLEQADISVVKTETHNTALAELVKEGRGKLLAAELMVKLGKIDFPHADFTEAKKLARLADESVRQGKLGYALFIGQKR